MKKIVKNIFIISVLLVIVMLQTTITFADNKSDLQNQQNELNSQITETKNEISEIESEKSEVLNQIKKLLSDITEYEEEIDDLNAKISELNTKIEEAEKNIKIQEEEYAEQQKLLEERLVVMYETGDISYLDVLCSSKSIIDFISNYYLVEQIMEYDTELLEGIENKRKEIENEKNTLENNKEELNNSKKSVEAKNNQLKATKQQKNEVASKLNEEEKQRQSELEQYEAEKKQIDAQLKKIAEEEAAKSKNNGTTNNATIYTSNPSKSGFIFPVKGYRITTGYGTYPSGGRHGGVDISGSGIFGKPVLAVKDGTVVISQAMRNANGSYGSYGEYVAISHGDGLMTLYAHGQAGSRVVSVGETVKQGQQIMSVGSTGNSTGPHLHFEVRINGSRVNPTPYLP